MAFQFYQIYKLFSCNNVQDLYAKKYIIMINFKRPKYGKINHVHGIEVSNILIYKFFPNWSIDSVLPQSKSQEDFL